MKIFWAKKWGIFERRVNLIISFALDFNINYIFNKFFLAVKLFIIDLFILTRGKNREKKPKIIGVRAAIGDCAAILSEGHKISIQEKA